MKFFAAIFVIMLLVAPIIVAAQTPSACSAVGFAGNNSTFPKCVSQIYIWSLGLAGLLALLMTVIGAYSYMTAAGNAERAQRGTEMIWGSVIGLALLFGAYLLLNTINPDLTNFRIGAGTCIKDGKPISAVDASACTSAGGTWYSATNESPQTPAPTSPRT